jgi:hypothetical protein
MPIHHTSPSRYGEDHPPLEATATSVLPAAMHLVRTCRARIVRAASRIAGNDGLALAHAFCDMVLDGMDPDGWPLLDLLEVLKRPETSPDRQTERIVSELEAIARHGHLSSAILADLIGPAIFEAPPEPRLPCRWGTGEHSARGERTRNLRHWLRPLCGRP